MKFKLITFTFLAFSISPLFAQTNNIVERGFACSINDGYSMRDVVEVARNFEWSEDAAPAVVIFRSAVAVAGEFQNSWDFVFASYYTSYADMVEKRGVFLNRSGGRTGVGLSDVATCGDRVRISNMQFSSQSEGGPPAFSLAASWVCELNGDTFADALNMASGGEQAFGSNARAAVTRRAFGGPPIQNNSQVEIRMTFPSAADFGVGFDAIQQGTPPANAITCSGGSMWAQYLIHSRNN
tara:strand:+ start:1153 stop:1869 length:717 start_codon:yes stop_codon:yes gene_type:complete